MLAGPGSGKTHVVAARIVDLVVRQGLRPGSELLLLSYTRAAVHEMRQRLLKAVEWTGAKQLSMVNIRTMDSLAYELHVAAGVEHPGGYDDGIASAARLLLKNRDAHATAHSLRHIIVDEAQDLIGVRDLFVRTLLAASGKGFTVLGDPRQAIYDYLLFEEGIPPNTGFDELRRFLASQAKDLAERSLRGSHRHTGAPLRLLDAANHVFERSAEDPELCFEELVNLLEGEAEADIGEPLEKPEVARLLEQEQPGTTAILTRTNGEALCISNFLLDSGIDHRLATGSESPRIPGWVGRILPDLPDTFGERDVEDSWLRLVGSPVGSVQDGSSAWAILSQAAGEGQRRILKDDVVASLRNPNLFPAEGSYDATHSRKILVSTVHRAKGREFDRVFFLMPNVDRVERAAEMPLESKVVYVAMTRPKSSFRAFRFQTYCSRFKDAATGEARWYQKPWNTGANLPAKVEVRAGDFDQWGAVSVDRESQDIIWEFFGTGEGGFVKAAPNPEGWFLRVEDDGPPLTVGRFRKDAVRMFNDIAGNIWSSRSSGLSHIWVEGVATYAGEPPPFAVPRFAESHIKRGYWLAPVLRGFATMWRRR